MKYVAVMGILTFWLVGPGRVGPLLAQQTTALGPMVFSCSPEGQPQAPIQSYFDCLEYDNAGECIHSKTWLDCWNPVTNETYWAPFDLKEIRGEGEPHQQQNTDAPGGASR